MNRKTSVRTCVLCVVVLITLFSILRLTILAQSDNLSLPAPDLEGHMSLSSAINRTEITEALRDHQTEIQEVSQLLWAVQGTTHGPNFRTVPSAGATYPLEVFVLHGGSSTLSEGCYRYIPQGHQLEEVSTVWNMTEFLSAFNGEAQEAIANVSTIFVILAEYARTTNRYGNRGIQYVHLEVGHAIQNFLLQATSLNLYTHVITQFVSNEIQAVLDTEYEPLVILPVGINPESVESQLGRRCALSQDDEFNVEQAILERKSTRDYLNGSIPLSVFQDILTDSTNIEYLVGNQSEVDIRVVAGQVEDLSNGIYHYNLENDSLGLISSGDQRPALRVAGLGQDWIESAQLDIVMSVNTTWINQQTDSEFYDRIMMFNIGMIAQNVYLKCAAYGLGTVVIGAFYENEVIQVVESPDGIKPIYIMPIGLTSKFFERTETYQIAVTELARISGVIIFVLFYCSLYLSVPCVKRRIPKKLRWLHCLLGIVPLLLLIIHNMVLHGHVRSIWDFFNIDSWVNATFHWVSGIFIIPISFYDLGQFAAYLCVPVFLIATITGIGPIIKHRKLCKLHKPSISLSLALMLIHALTLVHSYFIRNTGGFLLLNIGAVGLYFLLKYYPKLVRKYKRENSSMAPEDAQ